MYIVSLFNIVIQRNLPLLQCYMLWKCLTFQCTEGDLLLLYVCIHHVILSTVWEPCLCYGLLCYTQLYNVRAMSVFIWDSSPFALAAPRVLECCGLCVVVNKVPDTVGRVPHLPPLRKGVLLDNSVGTRFRTTPSMKCNTDMQWIAPM